MYKDPFDFDYFGSPKEKVIAKAIPDSVEFVRKQLSEEQSKALDLLLEFMQNDKSYFTLKGYAGTGKTFLIGKFISMYDYLNMALTAPTNKAVKELRKKAEIDVTCKTIHKLLNLTLKWVYPKDHETFEPYQILHSKGDAWEFDSLNLLIIDESSMLSDELFEKIHQLKDKQKIIFMGDIAQIPPVAPESRYGDRMKDSIPLTEKNIKEYDMMEFELKQIMRQPEGSNILPLCGWIRDNRFTTSRLPDRLSKKDVRFYSANYPADVGLFFTEMIGMFTSRDFEMSQDYCKTIAYRNITVNALNDLIRKHIYKTTELEMLMPNEKIIISSPAFSDGAIILNTSDEVAVISSNLEMKEVVIDSVEKKSVEKRQQLVLDTEMRNDKTAEKRNKYQYYRVAVTDGSREYIINVLHPKSANIHKITCAELANKKLWSKLEDLKNFFTSFSYNYAITAHKAQGSTYENVFVMEDDINKIPNVLELNRVKYTACTRPKNRLYMLSKLNSLSGKL